MGYVLCVCARACTCTCVCVLAAICLLQLFSSFVLSQGLSLNPLIQQGCLVNELQRSSCLHSYPSSGFFFLSWVLEISANVSTHARQTICQLRYLPSPDSLTISLLLLNWSQWIFIYRLKLNIYTDVFLLLSISPKVFLSILSQPDPSLCWVCYVKILTNTVVSFLHVRIYWKFIRCRQHFH